MRNGKLFFQPCMDSFRLDEPPDLDPENLPFLIIAKR